MLHAAACRCMAERPLGRALSSRRAGRRPLGAWSVFGFAARVRHAAARVIAESFGGKWLVETRDAAVLGLGLEQAVVEAQGLAAWSWACRVRWDDEGRRGREAGRLSARACWLVSAHGFLFFCLLSVIGSAGLRCLVELRARWSLAASHGACSASRRVCFRAASTASSCGRQGESAVAECLCRCLSIPRRCVRGYREGFCRWTRLFCF